MAIPPIGRGNSCLSIGQNILRAFLGAVSDRQLWQIVCKHGSCFGSSIYSSLQTGHDVLSLDGRLSLFAFWKKAMVTKSLSVRFDQNKLLSKRLEWKCEITIKQSSTVLSNQEELFRIIENHFLSDCAVQSQSTYSLCFCSKIRLTSMCSGLENQEQRNEKLSIHKCRKTISCFWRFASILRCESEWKRKQNYWKRFTAIVANFTGCDLQSVTDKNRKHFNDFLCIFW